MEEEENKKNDIMTILPEQALIHISNYLRGYDLAKLAATCVGFYKFTCDDMLWKQAIYNELTQQPKLLKRENYFMYYKRAYLGQNEMLSTFLLKGWNDPELSLSIAEAFNDNSSGSHLKEINYSTYAKDTFILEKFFSYANYIKNTSQNIDTKTLSMYLCHAAKHGYEVWAKSLLQRGALFSGVNIFNLSFYPISIAVREGHHHFIDQIIKYFLRKYSGDTILNAIADNSLQGRYSYASAINNILLESVKCPSQLNCLLSCLKLTPECQAAIKGDINQLQYYIDKEKVTECIKQDIYGMDPLRYATIAGHFNCCQFLVKSGMHYNHCRSSLRAKSFIQVAIDKMGIAMLKTLRHHQVNEFSTNAYDNDPMTSYDLAFIYAMSKALARPSNYFDTITFLLPDLIQYKYYKKIFDHVVSIGDMNMFRPLVINYKQFILDHVQNQDECFKMIATMLDSRNKSIRYVDEFQHPQLLRTAFKCISDLPNILVYASSRLDSHLKLNVFNDWSIFSSSHHYDATVAFYYKLSQVDDSHFNPKQFALELTSYNLLIVLLELINRCNENQRSEIIFCMFWSVMNMEWNHRLFQDESLERKLDQVTECYFEAMLNAGYHINDCTRTCHSTAAHYAITKGKTHWVQFFLAAGADSRIKNIRSLSLHALAQAEGVAIELLNNYSTCPLPCSKDQNVSFWWLK